MLYRRPFKTTAPDAFLYKSRTDKKRRIYMCGIVGYIGEKKAAPILVDGLKKLEYRGYDSAGVALIEGDRLSVFKCKGRLAALEEKLSGKSIGGNIGIGHTRWATHGEPNDVNSHPHLSSSGKIAVVHNGIIENYMKLKRFLTLQGYEFLSDTDTEIVAQLVDYYYKQSGDIVKAVMESIDELEGSYALGVLCADCPSKFIAARKDSPLIVGLGKGENYIASDIPAILEHTRDIYILEDKDVAVLSKDNVTIYDNYGVESHKEVFHVDWDVEAAEKSGFEHFMMKEMFEEPKVIRDTMSPRIRDGRIVLDDISMTAEYLKDVEKIFIVACGTAFHAGMVGKYLIEKLARIPVETDLASEFRYRDPILSDRNLVIIISQSGETIDTLFAMREAKKRGARVLSIVNVVGSSIARESDDVLYTWAGPEIAVASTKAYNTQLTALALIALDFACKRGTLEEARLAGILEGMSTLPAAVEKILSHREDIQRFASKHYNAKSIFFIGRGLDYALSMEGSLKLKEISYIHSEAYAGGELKHGTIALIEEGTLVVCPMTQDNLYEKMVSNIREVKARGAVVMAITQQKNAEVEKLADMVVSIPDIDPLLAPIAAITTMQLFAYYMAVLKGCDVDKPRNLAKSVTVE
jgi:glucosamine--fructose-6-phosphate aminotransferase (isomerizing)